MCGKIACTVRWAGAGNGTLTRHRASPRPDRDLFGWPKYDHYSSELVLLYAIRFGSIELWHFIQAIEQRTGAHLADPDEVIKMLEAAETATSYFWFLGAHPHAYDTWKAHNEASFRALQAGGAPELPPEPGAEDVPYPANPLRRLVAMHSSANELLTGLAFVSPWPREDARFRR